MLLRLAALNVRRSPARSLVTLGAVALGSAAVIAAGGFIADTIAQTRDEYIAQMLGHLQVARRGHFTQAAARPYDRLIEEPETAGRLISSHPKVRGAASSLQLSALLSNGDASVAAVAEGRSGDGGGGPALELAAGSPLDDAHPEGVLLGAGVATALGLKPGDPVTLLTATASGALNGADLRVRGVFQTASKDYDDHAARLTLGAARRLLRTRAVQAMTVHLASTADTDAVAADLRRAFAARGLDLEVRTWDQCPGADFVLKLSAFFARLFLVFQVIVFAVVVLGIYNTLNMSVIERVGEIGTMMALGATRASIVRLFMLEGLILGAAGGLLGAGLGCALAAAISAVGIPMPTAPGTNTAWVARIAIHPPSVAAGLLLSLATALVSAAHPALKASRLEIAEALRRNV